MAGVLLKGAVAMRTGRRYTGGMVLFGTLFAINIVAALVCVVYGAMHWNDSDEETRP